MGTSVRTRPRRLLLELAAIPLFAGIFLAIQSPLFAQDQTQVRFALPDKNNSFVTGEEIAQGDRMTFTEGREKKRVSVNGRTFPQMLDLAEQRRGERISGVGVYALDRPDMPPLYVTQGDNLFFFVQSGVVKWFLYDEDTKVLDRGDGATLRVQGLEGEHLKVEIAVTPEDARAGDEVTFDANPTGEQDGEKLSYRWFVDGFDKVDARGEIFKQTFKN